jgi:rod shape-determining protein MreC
MPARNRSRQKKALSAEVYVFGALVFTSVLLLFFSTQSFIVNFGNIGLSTFSGIRGGIYRVSSFFKTTVLSVREVISLRREYAELAERMTRYEQLERSAAEIRQENYRLREQLEFSQSVRYTHIAAEISGRDPTNLFSAFVINKGKKNGVENGMPVIAYQNGMEALAGKVINAGLLESLVMPLYDTTSFAAARFAQSRYEGIVEGQGNTESPLLIRFISKRARDEIGRGDLVITSGMGGVFPAGITIGRVINVTVHEDETSMEAELESALDFSRLEYMFVIAPENTREDSP